jgi:hypothetical protein
MANLGETIRENCRHKYIDYAKVPAEKCIYCTEKSRCGKNPQNEEKT